MLRQRAGLCGGLKVQSLSREQLQLTGYGIKVAAVIIKGLAGTLSAQPHGAELPGIGPVNGGEEERRGCQIESGKNQACGGFFLLQLNKRALSLHCRKAFRPQQQQHHQPTGRYHCGHRGIRGDQMQTEQLPVKRGKQINPVAPLVLK